MRVELMGKRYTLRFCRLPDEKRGDCDPPWKRGKQIRISSKLKDREELEILIHEMMHGGDWWSSEELVHELSADIAKVLWKLGYRKIGN